MSHFHHHDKDRSADLDLFFEDDKIAIDITEHHGSRMTAVETLIHYTQVGGLIDALTEMRDALAAKYEQAGEWE